MEKKVKFEPPNPRQRRVEPMQRERKVFWIKGPGGTMVESTAADEQEEQQQQQVLPPGARERRCECLCTSDGEQCWNNVAAHHTLCGECMDLHSTMNGTICITADVEPV